MGAFRFIKRLVSAVLLGDVGHKVEDTAGVAPLCEKKLVIQHIAQICAPFNIPLSYQETSLMKFSLRAIPALASKMEEAGLPLRSEETSSSSE